MASIAVELNEWNTLYLELRKVLIELQRAYDKNPTIENRKNLRKYLKEQRDYIEIIAELSKTKFNQLYYDMLDLESKKQYLISHMELLSNVKGKKILVDLKDGKKSIAKTIKADYIKYANMLDSLEQKIVHNVISEKTKKPSSEIEIVETHKKTIDLKNIINTIKKKGLQFVLSTSCAMCLTTTAMGNDSKFVKNDVYIERNFLENEVNDKPASQVIEVIEKDEDLYTENLKATQYELFIKTYADYFALDGDKVVNLAKELTDDYKIPFSEINNSLVDGTDNPQIESMMFVTRLYGDNLYKKLKDLGYSKKDFALDREIKNLPEDFILDSGMHYNDYLVQIADLMQLDKDMALAISYHETGRVTSSKAKNKNNFGGLGEMIFPTPEAGVMYYCCNLKEYENIVSNMNQLSGRYVNGNKNNPSYEWISKVNWFYNDIQENQEKYYGNNTEQSKNLLLK